LTIHHSAQTSCIISTSVYQWKITSKENITHRMTWWKHRCTGCWKECALILSQ
jgi:hypothetical protein